MNMLRTFSAVWLPSLALSLFALAVSPDACADDAPATGLDPEAALEAVSGDSCEDLLKLWEETGDTDATPIENLVLPLESHPNGRVKTLLRAKTGLVPVDGIVRGTGVLVERYDDSGRLDCIIAAENCIFDRETQRGYCEGNVRIERKGVRITGVDMVWRVKEQGAKILSNAKVIANRFVKDMGTLLK